MERLTITQVFIRDDTSIPWFHETIPQKYPNHTPYMFENYVDSGDVVISKEISEDKTLLIFTYQFKSDEAKERMANDEYVNTMIENRLRYNTENNIINIA